jgi:hypothetical protein
LLAPAAERGVGRIDEGVLSGDCEMVGRRAIVNLLIVVVTLLLAASATVEAQPTGPTVQTVGVLAPHDQYREREYPAFLEVASRFVWKFGAALPAVLADTLWRRTTIVDLCHSVQ